MMTSARNATRLNITDFSEDETESEVSSIGNDDESSHEDSDEKNDDAPGLSKCF
jgi:hypothetical protein